jgi:hypothetical protein
MTTSASRVPAIDYWLTKRGVPKVTSQAELTVVHLEQATGRYDRVRSIEISVNHSA